MDITAKYSRNAFISFLSNSFLPEDFQKSNENIIIDKPHSRIKIAEKLGYCPSLDLSVYEFKHESAHDPRITLSRESFKIIETNDIAASTLAVFYNEDTGKPGANWRFSLITSDYSVDKNKKQVKRSFSNPRRFSYLLGENCKRHTPELMLFERGKVNSIEDLCSRFAIDVVTKKFYGELFNWYDKWAVNTVKFPAGLGAKAALPKNPDAEANRQHLIRLITRLIFVWFIKQKDLIPEWVFDKKAIKTVLSDFDPHSAEQGNYYNGILQNLFFATLNKEIALRSFTEKDSRKDYGIKTIYRDHADTLFKISQAAFVKKFETVPFLNGGLFECLDRREGSEKQCDVDGFNREKSRAAFVPNSLFFGDGGGREGIIELFNRYNFTVEENTPQDIDIALDPELLGKVFENLLGTYNEETKSTARNESGSFYTPREIVDYMVDTSLKEYFKQKLTTNEHELKEKLDKLFSYHEITHNFSRDEVKTLMNAIHQCKILDPACGSGAFPMGVLNKLVFILEKLDPDNKLWRELQKQKAQDEMKSALDIVNEAERKQRLKEIDDVFEFNQSNYGRKLFLIENCIYGVDIQPIAIQISKLRFFISLIVDQKTGGGKENNYNVLPLPNLETKFVAANTLIGVKREQGVLADPAIEVKQQELLVIRHKHFRARKADEKIKLRKQDVVLSKELAALLKKDGFCNSADAQKMADWNPYDQTCAVDFFDPYWMFGITDGFDVVIGNPPYGAKLSEEELKYFKTTYCLKTSESAILFIEKGLDLGRMEIYIVPKSFTFASNYATTRNYVEKELQLIGDCGKAFDNVLLEAVIVFSHKCKTSDYYTSVILNNSKNFIRIGKIPKILKNTFGFYPNGITEQEIFIGEKILRQSIFLNDIAHNSRGEMLQKYITEKGNYPIIGGKEISSYGVRGIKGYLNDKSLLKEKSAIKRNSILVQNIIAHITKPIDHIKITACIPENNNINITDTINQITITDKNSDRKIIWALLNCKAINWYAYYFIFGKAIRTMHFDNYVSSRIPIPKINLEQQKPFVSFVDQMLSAKAADPQADTSVLERDIDTLVYRLYNLTWDEVKVIEPGFPLDIAEYEGMRI